MRGDLEEVGLVEGAGRSRRRGPHPGDGRRAPDGRPSPRFKAFAPRIAPPPPSPAYRQDARYATQGRLRPGRTRMQAIGNFNPLAGAPRAGPRPGLRLAGPAGVFGGDGTRAVYVAQSRSTTARAQALSGHRGRQGQRTPKPNSTSPTRPSPTSETPRPRCPPGPKWSPPARPSPTPSSPPKPSSRRAPKPTSGGGRALEEPGPTGPKRWPRPSRPNGQTRARRPSSG